MSKILVSGLVNIEVTCNINQFPIEYSPIDYVFNGVGIFPAGVGLNISLALRTLGDEVKLCSVIGEDISSSMITKVLEKNEIDTDLLMKNKDAASSVVLFDNDGKRKIYCDLKNIQDISYDTSKIESIIDTFDAFCICNINFSRSLLELAKTINKPIATDVHCISDIYDEYNTQFMRCSDIIFLSNENIIGKEEQFINSLKDEYSAKVIVIGMGSSGSLVFDREENIVFKQPVCSDYDVINTVGAGDALFSAFVHFYVKGYSVKDSISLATKFAAIKISCNGAAKGFVDENTLLRG